MLGVRVPVPEHRGDGDTSLTVNEPKRPRLRAGDRRRDEVSGRGFQHDTPPLLSVGVG